MADDYLPDPGQTMLAVTILRGRRGWQVMWLGASQDFRDFRAATLAAAVADASAMAAEFYGDSLDSGTAEFLIMIFGRHQPVFNGPQLLVAGEPGQFTATDARDDSVFAGATLEDLLAAAGPNPAQAGDYAINWIRPVSALLPDP